MSFLYFKGKTDAYLIKILLTDDKNKISYYIYLALTYPQDQNQIRS